MSQASSHLSFMKVLLDKPLSLLQRDQKISEHDIKGKSEFYDAYDCKIVKVKEEHLFIMGNKVFLYRIFIHTPDSGEYESTGWILPLDVDCCMICYQAFGMFTYKHSCRGCGNVVCSKCSPETAIIAELARFGPQRVCTVCYYGQNVSGL
jgi:hypothetical protein